MQELASLYALGTLGPEDRKEVEECAAANPVFGRLLRELSGVTAGLCMASVYPGAAALPAVDLKSRLAGSVETRMPSIVTTTLHIRPEEAAVLPVVVTGPDIKIRWISPGFTGMCGYDLADLRGRKPGPILQGKDTDRRAARTLREAIRALAPVTQEILNYDKDGLPYMVSISISPVVDATGKAVCFVALEHRHEE
jgi:PAS domain-containing protein